MTDTTHAPKRKMLTPNGGLPTGNWPKGDLVPYIREDNLLDRIKELEDQVAQLQWDVLRLEARLND